MTAPDPAKLAEDARLLLSTGRTAMALRLLEELPEQIREGLRDATGSVRAELERAREAAAATVASTLRQADAAGRQLAAARAELARIESRIERRRRELARLAIPISEAKPKPHERLAAALAADQVTPGRVAELLNIRPEDVPPIAEGRVQLARSAWSRVLRELGAA